MTFRLSKPSEVPDLANEIVFLDTETDGIDYMQSKPFMLLLGVGNRNFMLRWDNATIRMIDKQLPKAKLVAGFNLKFDCHMLINGGVSPAAVFAPPMFCSMLADALCYEHHRNYNMEAVAGRWSTELKQLGVGSHKYPIEDDIARVFMLKSGPKLKQYLHKMPIEMVLPYADQDINLTRGLFRILSRELIRQSLTRIAKIEFECLKVLCRMEKRGAPIDWAEQHQAWLACNESYSEMDDELTKIVGYRTNPDSRPSLIHAFNTLGLSPLESYDKEHLLTVDHPVAKQVLDMRSLKKMISTFVLGPKKYAARDGRIHADYNQLRGENEYGVVTGRLSISHPNLQQVPMRTARWAEPIRRMFASPDRDWGSADWSQFEYRIFASATGDEGVIKRYREDPNVNFHQTVADIAGITYPRAKSINLGLVFGMGEGKMAKLMGMPYTTYIDRRTGFERHAAGDEAKAIFNAYHQRIPGAKRFLSMSDEIAKKTGFVVTLLGRRLRFPEGHTHKAGGLVFQGTAADLMKMKLVELDRELPRCHSGSELILVVHDEYDFLFPKGEDEPVKKTVQEILESVPELNVPVKVDIGTGRSWWEACS